jgi:hypothetical protein
MDFARSGVAQLLASGLGRLTRIGAGLALLWAGLIPIGGTAGTIVSLVGLVPIAAGVFVFCLLTALFGGPMRGAVIRRRE